MVGIARRPGTIEHANYRHLRADLGELGALAALVEAQVGSSVANPAISRLALVNNAALIGLLGKLEQVDPGKLLQVYAVNVAAPIWLMGWLLRRAAPTAVVRIVNVSSAAGVRAFPGLGAYGSAKAALRLAGMVLALELDASRDASVLSFEPGIVDTDMQATARTAPPEVLPSFGFFQQVAAEGRLAPPAAPARVIVDYLDGDGHPKFSEDRYEPS